MAQVLTVDTLLEIDLSRNNYLPLRVRCAGGTITHIVAELSDIGGAQNQDLNDDGQSGDVIPGDGVWSYVAPIFWVPESEVSIEISATLANGQSMHVTKLIPVIQFIQFKESDQANLGNPAIPVESWFNVEDINPEWMLDPNQHLSYSRVIHGREVTVVFDDNFDFSGIAGYDAEMVAELSFKTFETYWNIFGGFPYQKYQVNLLHNPVPIGSAFTNGCVISDAIHNPMGIGHEMCHSFESYAEYGIILPAPPPYHDDRRILWISEGAVGYNAARIAPKMGGGQNTYFWNDLNLHDTYPDLPLSEWEKWQQVELGEVGNKGVAVFYLLDKMIVQLTNGKKNIEDLWRYFYYHYGVNLDNPDQPDPDPEVVNPLNQPLLNYRRGDFLNALLEITDHQFDEQFREFWTKYVDGLEPLPETPIFYINHNLNFDPDSDRDGLPDSWEVIYFGLLTYGPNDDPDGDGLTNLEEYLRGTDPTIAEQKTIDFDGDGKTDVAVYHSSSGLWFIKKSSDGTSYYVGYGGSDYVPVPGDYDGDGKTDVAVYHSSSGLWFIRKSSDETSYYVGYGGSAYVPVSGDYDGDGKTDVAVYHSASGLWFIKKSSDGTSYYVGYGGSAYVPVPGDYDGDGKTDVAVYHSASGLWFIKKSSDGTSYYVGYGGSAYVPVPGDYDGDGKTDVAVYHSSSGLWFIKKSSDETSYYVGYGGSAYFPVPGDYDGDGKTDIAVYHSASGLWFIKKSSDGTSYYVGYGGSDYIPVNLDYLHGWVY